VDVEEDVQPSVENLYSSEHNSFSELSKIAVGGIDGGGEAIAPIEDANPILSPPGR